jgi:stage II sporulation protein GA (sporulation sigma-E factor processing peptidase)
MTRVVYADLLFLVNFSMDFLCLFVSARLLRREVRMWRLLLSASAGGVYSVVLLFIPLVGFYAVLLDLGFCALMCVLAYGVKNGGAF